MISDFILLGVGFVGGVFFTIGLRILLEYVHEKWNDCNAGRLSEYG